MIKAGHPKNQAIAAAYSKAGLGKDMKPEDWDGMLGGLGKFFAEEAREPEHAEDAFAPAGRAASIAFVSPERTVLLLKRSPIDDNFAGYWCFPGGKVDDGETVEDAAKREATEEVGPCPLDGIMNIDTVTTARDWEHTTYAVPAPFSFTPKLSAEHVECGWYPINELPSPVHPGVMASLKSVFERVKEFTDSKLNNGFGPAEMASDKLTFIERPSGGTSAGWHVKLAADRDIGPFVSRDMAERAAALVAGRLPDGLAFDKSSARVYDKDGRLHLEQTHISKAGVCPYKGSEIPGWNPKTQTHALGLDPERVYQLLRDPKELDKSAPTFNGVPLMIKHVPTSAEDHQYYDTVGAVGTSAAYNHPYLDNAISVWPQAAIDGVEDESQRELSSSYHYTPDMTPGAYEGTPYDGVMRDIIGNHVALVQKGRAGPDVLVGDEAIHNHTEKDMQPKVLSRTAARTQGALCAYMLPRLAADAMPKFTTASATFLKDVNRKNFKDKRASIVKFAKDAAEPMLTPEAKASGGVGPDAVMMRILDLVDQQVEGSGETAEMDEQPGTVTAPSSGGPIAAGESEGDWRGKVMQHLKAKGMDEAGCKEVMDMMPKDLEKEDPEDLNKERPVGKDAKPDPKAGEPAMVTKTAMDAAIADATKKTHTETMATLRAIQVATAAVRPLVGEISVAMDSADEVYAAALKAKGRKIDGVHPSAYPAMVEMLVEQQAAAGRGNSVTRVANDAAMLTGRAAFDKENGIASRPIKHLGAA
jgi:hypothetical protein